VATPAEVEYRTPRPFIDDKLDEVTDPSSDRPSAHFENINTEKNQSVPLTMSLQELSMKPSDSDQANPVRKEGFLENTKPTRVATTSLLSEPISAENASDFPRGFHSSPPILSLSIPTS